MRFWREATFLAAAFAAATAVMTLSEAGRERFSDFGFGAPPLLMLALATVLGTAALASLRARGFFRAAAARDAAIAAAAGAPAPAPIPVPSLGLGAALRWATLFAIVAVAADLLRPFGRDINVPWPDAWVFYPAMAVAAAAVLHLAPLALIYALTHRAWLAILAAALTEPALQVALDPALSPEQAGFVALQVFAFGLVGLTLLRRHGVAALLAFRLAYYLWWHVLWGAARLALPFGGP